MKDCESYTHELETLYELLDKVIVTCEEIFPGRIPSRGAYGKNHLLARLGEELSPYSGETAWAYIQDVCDDIRFITKGLEYTLERINDDDL